MTTLDELRPDATLRGILPDCSVTVVNVQWFDSEALELTYKDSSRRVVNVLLYRHDEPRLELVEEGRPWSFDGDGQGVLLYRDRLWEFVNLRNDLQHYQDGLFMLGVSTFDERAVREAVLNAVSHCDYRHGAPISELQQVLPSSSRDQIKRLLDELRREGRVRLGGERRGARWLAVEGG